MLTWNGILLAIFKLLTPDAPYLALRGLYVSIIGGIISIFFLVRYFVPTEFAVLLM